MSVSGLIVYPEVLRSIDSATFTGSYQMVGSPFLYPSKVVKFANISNVTVTVSWDGTNDHDVYPANSYFVVDENTNRSPNAGAWAIVAGQQFWVKAAQGSGLFYIVTFFSR